MEKLDEHNMILSGVNAQRHVTPFKAEVTSYITLYADVTDTLDLWTKVQVLWQSLQPVFTTGDIAKAMPKEAKAFKSIDKNWLSIMAKAVEQKKVTVCC